jgi:MOSC domain-containing protein YiiM
MHNQGTIAAICISEDPGLPKYEVEQCKLIENYGVEDDYHAGEYVRHRYLAKKDPTRPNIRQVLLADDRIYENIANHGIQPKNGMLGENLVVAGIDLMSLPLGIKLAIGPVLLEITEIREPCYQLNEMHPKLQEVVMPDEQDENTWRAGMMAVVLQGGIIKLGDAVRIVENSQA